MDKDSEGSEGLHVPRSGNIIVDTSVTWPQWEGGPNPLLNFVQGKIDVLNIADNSNSIITLSQVLHS